MVFFATLIDDENGINSLDVEVDGEHFHAFEIQNNILFTFPRDDEEDPDDDRREDDYEYLMDVLNNNQIPFDAKYDTGRDSYYVAINKKYVFIDINNIN